MEVSNEDIIGEAPVGFGQPRSSANATGKMNECDSAGKQDHQPSDAQVSAGMQMLTLTDVEVPFSHNDSGQRRIYTTLFSEPVGELRGGLGQIRRVRTATGLTLALKEMLLPEERTLSDRIAYEKALEDRERAFREEYETLCRLSNFRGFPRIYACGKLNGVPVILMEWIWGLSLAKAVDMLSGNDPEHRVPPLRTACIGRDVFHLLARLERETTLFVHRDISPANIMIRTSERTLEQQMVQESYDICLVDFGSTAIARVDDRSFTTVTSILRGATPNYAPPEMLSNDLPDLAELRQSTKIDVYAACSVLYELLCGHPPFSFESEGNVYSDYLYKMNEPISPSGYAKGSMEELLIGVLKRGIAPRQANRPSSYEMYRMLFDYIERYPDNQARASRGQGLELGSFEKAGNSGWGADQASPPNMSAKTESGGGSHPKRLLSRRQVIISAGVAIGAIALGSVGAGQVFEASSTPSDSDSSASGSGSGDDSGTEADSSLSSGNDQVDYAEAARLYTGTLSKAVDNDSGLAGFLDDTGRWIIPAQFKDVGTFTDDGLASATDESLNLIGYIDRTGAWKIKPRFIAATAFGEGLAAVCEQGNDQYGYIDTNGTWAIEPSFAEAKGFYNGLAAVKSDAGIDGTYGYIDKNGLWAISPQFAEAGAFVGDLAAVALHVHYYGYIDRAGAMVIEPQFGRATYFSNGLAGVMDPFSEKWGFIDVEGNTVIEKSYSNVQAFGEGLAGVQDPSTDLWGFMDVSGTWKISPAFKDVNIFSGGLCAAQDPDSSLWGYVDSTGNWAVSARFQAVR